ncbi:MAG: ATP-binding protein [Leptolyngbyaceae cyanobacterium RM2_2_4]|nr:ATP-binding protein [Leptolyngbyaceae cyanobacterium SM1_4_3]NJN90462.1 ATP-binding protein [Leptolyngbyaceae cyanobacterium SL_5_14]NJO50674.1 ATP-binding protein [Leptolyngbyaceae cyanobacterium RM2_2_4]
MNSAASSFSPIDQINAVLRNQNPFAQAPILRANHVWGKGFPDVESLNAHASDAVFRALDEIRAGLYPATSILITAQDGTGKTHIISRIRRYLQKQGGALFVYANKFDDLNRVKQGFQQILADSLSNIGRQEITQWQELATEMANDAIKTANLQAQFLPVEHLVKKFEDADEEQARKWIGQLTKAFRKAKDVKDPDIVRAIFWTLSEEQSSYAANWLGGKELAQYKANELGLPNQNQTFDTVLHILSLISQYNELIICFDELDLPDYNDAGLHKAQVISGLVKELYENLHRGVVLTVMMPGVWKDKVKQLPPGVWSRVTACGEPQDLSYMDGDSIVELVSRFLKEFYDEKGLMPPHPLYPFDEDQLRALGRERLTVRQVLTWCKDNCRPPLATEDNQPVPIDDPVSIEDPVETAFKNELEEDLSKNLDDNALISNALLFSLAMLVGLTVESVTIEEVTTKVKKRGGRDPYLNFKILGKEDGRDVSIGVAVLQYDGGGGLGAGFRRLVDEDKSFGLTRGCLVRSQSKPINHYFKKTYLNPLIYEKGGEFVDLKEEEIKPLIAIRAVHQKREVDYKLTEEQILTFIAEKGAENLLGIHNPLLKEILSDPSHQVPLLEDEPEVQVQEYTEDSDSDELEPSEKVELAGLSANA